MKTFKEYTGIKKSSLGIWVAVIIGLNLGFGKTERSNKELNASIEKRFYKTAIVKVLFP